MNEEQKYIPALTGALIVATLPHTATLPVWISGWCVLMWGYLLASLRFGWPRPGRTLRLLLSIAGITGILVTYSTRPGPEAYLGLLAVMAGLKPFESSTHRDRMITVFVAYFIVISKLLQSETFAITLYMFFSVLVTTATLVHINNPSGDYRSGIKQAGTIMGQAAPLMIVMFLLFPRLEGSLIGMRHTGQAGTGFSDQLSPGSISRLVENNDIAFRARFNGPVPEQDKLYWRGIVFTEFDGRSWKRASRVPELKEPGQGAGMVAYSISLEPHNKRWLFVLDIPAETPSEKDRLYRDFSVQAGRTVTRKKRYEMLSHTEYRALAEGWGVDAALRLPQHANPKTRQIGKRLASDTDDPEQIVEKGLDYLKKNGFSYTLEPPLLGNNPVDAFLFESRKGFCEHFASAFACLMRAAGVPARVVGGYLGGEINPFANYLIIRQSDAHAWVEVWYPHKGWTRVDPTLTVAPERLERGIEAAFSDREGEGGFAGKYLRPFTSFIDRIKLGWDAVSLRWEAFFYAYSQAHQRAFFEKIGIYWRSWKGPLAALGLGLGLAAAITFLYALIHFRSSAPTENDPVAKQYEKFCKKLETSGIEKPWGMGPKDFAEFALHRLPGHGDKIEMITDIYIRLRYKGEDDPAALQNLKALVRSFDPGRDATGSVKKFDFRSRQG